ncbi:MAG: NAD-dependent epimerase/dehydratase family protein [Candidatus Sungbacteria bacterium]|nr:NAD-dependent epimerase/dehydratase family protein [Candidatus Sungbacteria bacterium]
MGTFWKNKKVVVVGGAGFIGSHTVDELLRRDARVVIIGKSAFKESKRGGSFINPKAKFYRANAASPGDIGEVFRRERPDFVMNFAALTDIPLAIREPLRDAESIFIIINILENAVRFGVKKILHASSGFIYGNTRRIPTPETEPPQFTNSYAISKFACENYLKFFNAQYGLPYVSLRYANVYGPRRKTGVIPYFIRQIIGNEPSDTYGKKTRDCVFVSDAVRANLLAFEKSIRGSEPVFNIGSGQEASLGEIHSIIKKLLGKPKAELFQKPAKKGEVNRMCLDIRRAKKVLGFAPSVSLEEGLRQTVEWYKEYFR